MNNHWRYYLRIRVNLVFSRETHTFYHRLGRDIEWRFVFVDNLKLLSDGNNVIRFLTNRNVGPEPVR